jgi:uncharacterized protein
MIARMKCVLFYESAPDVLEKAPLHAATHRAHWKEFAEGGKLLMIGPFADPRLGAMGIFATRDAAEEFAARDPFVINGVVSRWYVRDWQEVVVPE